MPVLVLLGRRFHPDPGTEILRGVTRRSRRPAARLRARARELPSPAPHGVDEEAMLGRTGIRKLRSAADGSDDSDDTYYVTFWDGSYISVRRTVQDLGIYGIFSAAVASKLG